MTSTTSEMTQTAPIEMVLPPQSIPDVDDVVDEETLFEKLAPEDWPNIDHIITEDDEPMDNIFSEKQQRLLTESLYTSWDGPSKKQTFVAMANVGLFYAINKAPLVPDMLLSLDVQLPEDMWTKYNRSYFIWMYGKPPELVLEIVSNKKGGEAKHKLEQYARLGITYYIIYDPNKQLGKETLRLYRRHHTSYEKVSKPWLPGIKLGLKEWQGSYEGQEATWLRWCDKDENLILTGAELAHKERQRAEEERQRAEEERQHAEEERQRAEEERQRAERLLAQLRALGIEPDV